MLIATLALLTLQDPPAVPPRGAQDLPPVVVGVPSLGGGVQAPTQPVGESSASVQRGQRIEPLAARTSGGQVRVRVGDLVAVRNYEENVIQGIGLVTGLNGTGDSGTVAKQMLMNYLLLHNITVDQGAITSKNVALVNVSAVLEPGIKVGRPVDLKVSSWGDATSLVGGDLVQTFLTDSTGEVVYGSAAGSVSVGGFTAQGESASVTRNHPTVGMIPKGCKVERSVPTQMVSEQGYIFLDARAHKGSFGNIVSICDAINGIYTGAAWAEEDGMTVVVRVPDDLPETAYVAYLDSILRLEVVPDTFARIVINERTGVIVMGEGVRITRGAVTKGNVTVTIAESDQASQPGGFSQGETERLERTDLLVEEEDRALSIVNGAVDLQEVVEVLNVLGVTPMDMIQILQAMNQSGMLHAEIVSQ